MAHSERALSYRGKHHRKEHIMSWIREQIDKVLLTDLQWKEKYCPNLFHYLFEMTDEERHESWVKFEQGAEERNEKWMRQYCKEENIDYEKWKKEREWKALSKNNYFNP